MGKLRLKIPITAFSLNVLASRSLFRLPETEIDQPVIGRSNGGFGTHSKISLFKCHVPRGRGTDKRWGGCSEVRDRFLLYSPGIQT